jgi:hypothetical protein
LKIARLAFALDRLNTEHSLCSYCESRFSIRVQRKWMLIEARQRVHFGRIYRWPTDPVGGARDFYESSYDGQEATDLPDPADLERMTSPNFASTRFDKHSRGAFLNRTLGAAGGRKLLDFGCSWGYSVWQYQAAGYVACGFELDTAIWKISAMSDLMSSLPIIVWSTFRGPGLHSTV